SERQCREALLRLPVGRKGGDGGASSQASRTFCHSDTCGSRSSRSSRHAGGARGGNIGGCRRCSGLSGCSGHFHRDTSRGKTGGPCRFDAASGGGKVRSRQAGSAASAGGAASEKRGETFSERASPRRRPTCRDR